MNLQENIRRKLIENKQEQTSNYRELLNHTYYRIENRQVYESLRVLIQQREDTERKLNNLNKELERLLVNTPKRIPPII